MATVHIRVSIHQMQLALLAIYNSYIHDDGLAIPDDRNAMHIKHSCSFEFSIAPER